MSPEFTADHEQLEPTPRIYVASLSDYNSGLLHGTWLAADRDVDELQADIATMLSASPTTQRFGDLAEEWAIHDYEGFGPIRIGEYTSLERAVHLARGIREHGPAFAAFVAHEGDDVDDLDEQFADRYAGEWDSVEAYAEELLDDCGATAQLSSMPEWLQSYVRIDVEAFARDLELGGDITAVEREDGGVWIFHS